MRKKTFILALVVGLLISVGLSDGVFANGPPINSDGAYVTALNGAAFRSMFKVTAKSAPGLGRITVFANMLVFPYEFLDNELIVMAGIPVLLKDRELNSGQHRTSGFGIGDLNLLAKYNLYQEDFSDRTFRIAAKAGIQVPTGKIDEQDSIGVLPRSLQRGKGSWNPNVGIVVTALHGRQGFNAGLSYTLNTKANGYEFGDVIKYDLAYSYRLLPDVYHEYPAHQINGFLELNGIWSAKHKQNSSELDNTGGHELLLSPGIQYVYYNYLIEASVQIPIVKALNGSQLSTEYAFNLGFRTLFF